MQGAKIKVKQKEVYIRTYISANKPKVIRTDKWKI